MAKIARRPKSDFSNSTTLDKPNSNVERLAEDFIHGGGKSIPVKSPQKQRGKVSTKTDPDAEIGITVKLLVRERDHIEKLREAKPKKRNKPISLQEWIVEAIEEKKKRESKQYNIHY